MTEPTRPLPDAPAEATDSAPAAVNITRLVAEAMSKSGILWIRLPGGDTHPAWFVWHDDGDERGTGPAAYVISGIGEQPLPWLTIGATVREIAPTDDAWDAAAAVLRPERLNLVGTTEDVDTRWRQGCTIHVLTPHGRPTEQPGAYAAEPGSRRIAPAKAATARWRPWHWRGRPQSRRGTR